MAKGKSRAKKSTPKHKRGKPASAKDPRAAIKTLLRGHAEADALVALFDDLVNERDALAAEHERQELRIKQLVHLVHGRRTEKLTKEELQQLALAFGADEQQAAEPDPDVPHEPAPADPCEQGSEGDGDAGDATKKKKRKRRSRTEIADDVQRAVQNVSVEGSDRLCVRCEREMVTIKRVPRRWLEYVPAKFILHEDVVEKVACRHSDCRGDIHEPARPQDSPERRKVDASLLAQLVQAKCDDALPVDRQRDQFERMGVKFPLNTLYTYWTYATTTLLPVAQITLARLLAQDYVGVDDTRIRVLDKSRRGGSYKGHLWCFTGAGSLVAYTFTESWEAQEIAGHIGAIKGFIQCDDYKGYGSVVTMPDGSECVLVDPDRRLGCMMHVRRRFHEALRLGDNRAARALELIGLIYEVEALAKKLGLDPHERLAMRTERSVPLMDDFDCWVDETRPLCTPKSPLGSALAYAEHQRVFVRRCLTDGRFEIDNGATERAIRRPCIGRNNYLFTGSPEAAERLAGAYTLVQSCRNLGLDTRAYLIDVLTRLEAGWPLRRIDELVPDRWADLHGIALAAGEQSGQ